MSHFLSAAHIAVECLHEFARIEAVVLAQVDEEALIAFLRFVHALLPIVLRLSLVFLLDGLLYFWCIGIVG